MTPKRYADAQRADRLKALLKEGAPVAAASFEAGYGSSSRAYASAPRHLGTTPAAYARGGKGLHLRYATVATPLGRLLVAATGRGVCFVTLGDSDHALEASLRREYPEALLGKDLGALAEWTDAIARSLAGPVDLSAIPLDLRATTFQRRVFEALRRIPRGETRTYAQLAEAIGKPTAVRAVGLGLRAEPRRARRPVPSHRAQRRRRRRLPLGRRAQARPPQKRKRAALRPPAVSRNRAAQRQYPSIQTPSMSVYPGIQTAPKNGGRTQP